MLPIASPPWTQKGKKLESATRKALFDYEMIEEEKIGIALSGGKDSLTLLYLLHAISGRGFPKFDLYALHVGGKFSCGAGLQENFISAICKELGVPLVTKYAPNDPKECYSCSRTRRKLLFDAAHEVGAKTIAFGHHRDDSAQTLLMNLLHKGEFASLLPKLKMVDYGVTIIRPLILISEDEIRSFAKHYGFARITCQCPVGAQSMRKKVDNLLSEMESLFPNARSNVASGALLYGSQKAVKKENNET